MSCSLTVTDRRRGMFYGLAIGDALGTPHEFFRVKPKLPYTGLINTEHTLTVQWQFATTSIPPASVSDDTRMSIALLTSIIENKMEYDPEQAALAYMTFANSTSQLGKNTRRLFKGVKTLKGYRARFVKFHSELVLCESNGTLMRASPLILLDELTPDHMLSNPNDINGDCNYAYLSLLRSIYIGKNKNQIKDDFLICAKIYKPQVGQAILDSLDVNFKRDITGKTKGWVAHSLYIAFYSFWHFEAMEQAMQHVVTIVGSDTDTNAAIAGTIFGSYLGYSGLFMEDKSSKNISIVQKLTPEISQIEALLARIKD